MSRRSSIGSVSSVYTDAVDFQPATVTDVRQRLEGTRDQCTVLGLMCAPVLLKDNLPKPVYKEVERIVDNFNWIQRALYPIAPATFPLPPKLVKLDRAVLAIQVEEPHARSQVIEELAKNVHIVSVRTAFAQLCQESFTQLMSTFDFFGQQQQHGDKHNQWDEAGQTYWKVHKEFDDIYTACSKVVNSPEREPTEKVKALVKLLEYKIILDKEVAVAYGQLEPQTHGDILPQYSEQAEEPQPQQPSQVRQGFRDKLKSVLSSRRSNSLAKAAAWEDDGPARISDRTRARYEI